MRGKRLDIIIPFFSVAGWRRRERLTHINEGFVEGLLEIRSVFEQGALRNGGPVIEEFALSLF